MLRRLVLGTSLLGSACAAVPDARTPVVVPEAAPQPVVAQPAAKPARPRGLELRTARKPDGIAVRLGLTGVDGEDVELVMADAHEGETGFEKAVRGLEASDDQGRLVLERRRERSSRGETLVAYRSTRKAVGEVSVRYTAVPKDETKTTGLRTFPGAVAGLGASFLLLPATPTPIELDVETEDGRTSLDKPRLVAPPGRLRSTMFAWGELRFAEVDGLRGVWIGSDPEQAATLSLTSRVLGAAKATFGDPGFSPTVFAMPSLGPTGMLRGAAQPGALVLQTGGRAPHADLLRLMVAHELLHQWIGIGVRIAGREGTRHWFSEGFTVHFAREILFREGVLGVRSYAEDVGVSTARYFTNPYRTASNRAIADLMHSEPTHERLPYDRGSLLALELDARIRAATANERSLVDLTKTLLAKAAQHTASPDGARFVEIADVRDALRDLAGDDAVKRLEAVAERGDDPDPPSWALGPCFRRVPRTYEQGLVRVQGFAWHVEGRDDETCKRRGPQ